MKLYGGYKGKRVAKKNYNLYKRSIGKRIAKTTSENNSFYQTIQLVSGKLKCFISKVQDFFYDKLIDNEDLEMEPFYENPFQQEESIAPVVERYPYVELLNQKHNENPSFSLEDYAILEEKQEIRVATLKVSSICDVDDIISFIEDGCIVIANYKMLNGKERHEFDKELSKQLMLLGTHLIHITSTEIICASRSIILEDRISSKKEGKVYELESLKKR